MTERNQLITIVDRLFAGVSAKTGLVEDFKSIVVQPERIFSYNDEIGVTIPIETGVSATISADDFKKSLVAIEEDSVELETINDGKTLTITSDSTEVSLQTRDASGIGKYIEQIDMSALEWKPIPEDLINALQLCLSSCSTALAAGVLSNIYVSGTDVCATNTLSISKYTLKEPSDEFMIPGSSVKELRRFVNIKEIAVGQGWVFFKSGDESIMFSRVISGDYPYEDIKTILEQAKEGKEVTFPKELGKEMDRISFMADGDSIEDKVVDVTVKNGEVFVKAEKSTGSITKKLKVPKVVSSDFSIGVSPYHMSAILNITTSGFLTESALLFQSNEYIHSVALEA